MNSREIVQFGEIANEVHYLKTGFEFDKENLSTLRTMVKTLENRSTE